MSEIKIDPEKIVEARDRFKELAERLRDMPWPKVEDLFIEYNWHK